MPVSKDVTITIPAPNIQKMKVRIEGKTPLIYHKWSEKAKREMLEKQLKKAQKGRAVRDPEQEYIDSFYLNEQGQIAFPAINIKQAIVGAARNIEGVTMTLLRGAVFIKGDDYGLIPLLNGEKFITLSKVKLLDEPKGFIFGIDSKNPNIEMRQDMVRVGMGSADLRFRGSVKNWAMDIMLEFNADVLSKEQVLNLLNIAGFSSGLGEWRPEKNGDNGVFAVATT